MGEVPKFVRQRLQQEAAGEHPDANVLTAFAEGALLERERSRVLTHLSACATCREVVSLALPEAPVAAPTAIPSAKGWSRWPMLQWAGMAAAVVVVAAAVVVQNSRRVESTAQVARTESATKPPEPKHAEKTAPGATPAPVMNDRAEKESRSDIDAKGRTKAETRTDKKKDAGTGALANGYAASSPQENRVAQNNEPAPSQRQTGSNTFGQRQAQQNSANVRGNAVGGIVAMEQNQQPAAPPPPQPQVTNGAVEVASDAGTYDADNSQVESKARSALGSLKNDRAKREVEGRATASARKPAAVAGSMTAVAGTASKSVMKTAMVVSAQWRLSSEGALERSTDAGNSWQFVEVSAQPLKLRSFSTVGAEIWVGGTGGALYHSGDGGRTWTRVSVKAAGGALDSDIVRVEFLDARRGALKTASDETWTTTDAGATWSVQR
jgi:hypothetical protein